MPAHSTMPTNFRRYAVDYHKSKSIASMAESFMVTPGTIRNWLRAIGDHNIRPRENGIDRVRVMEMLVAGKSVREIAENLGYSRRSVEIVRREMRATNQTIPDLVAGCPKVKRNPKRRPEHQAEN